MLLHPPKTSSLKQLFLSFALCFPFHFIKSRCFHPIVLKYNMNTEQISKLYINIGKVLFLQILQSSSIVSLNHQNAISLIKLSILSVRSEITKSHLTKQTLSEREELHCTTLCGEIQIKPEPKS